MDQAFFRVQVRRRKSLRFQREGLVDMNSYIPSRELYCCHSRAEIATLLLIRFTIVVLLLVVLGALNPRVLFKSPSNACKQSQA